MEAVSSGTEADQARPSAPMAAADLEAAIAAIPGRKQRLRESFDRVVASAPPHFPVPFTWDDIDAHVSSLHASLSLRFRQMQLQQPDPGAPVSPTATHDGEQPHPGALVSATATHDYGQPDPGAPVFATATHDGEQPHPGSPVSPTHDAESIQEDEEMVLGDEDASPVQDGDEAGKDREDAGGVGAPCREAGATRDQEFPVPMRAHAPHAGSPMLRQPYTACPPDVLSHLNLQRQQPYMQAYQQEFPAMAYQQQEFPAMAPVAMNNYNIPPMVHQPYYNYNIPPMVQQPYYNIPPMVQQPYFRQEFLPDSRQEFFPHSRQEFFPDVMRQPPMGVDHVLQQQYMAMEHNQPYFPQQQYMAHHGHHFSVAQAASAAHSERSKAKRRRPCRTTNTDAINVHISEPSKVSKTIRKHDAKPNPNHEPFQKKTIYDYF